MADIGSEPQKVNLTLATGGNFQWTFQWQGGNYPAGSELYLLVGNANSKWSFTITGDTAVANVAAATADVIPNGAPFRLVYEDGSDVPSILAYGQVRRVEPRQVNA